MFQSFRRLVSTYNDAQEAVANTPDRLIVGHIMQSMTDNILQWSASRPDSYSKHPLRPEELSSLPRGDKYWREEERCIIFKNAKLGIVAELKVKHRQSHNKEVFYDYDVMSFTVNDETIDPSLGWELWCSYTRLKGVYDEAQRVAREARMAMETNERKWNLAERLLKMKRTPNGRLMAVNDEGQIVGCGDPYCECNELVVFPPPPKPQRTRIRKVRVEVLSASEGLLAPL